jgi:PKHD-type hydroxylase
MKEELSFYPWCYWDKAFSDREIDQIVEYCTKKELKKGLTRQAADTDLYRSSKVNFHDYDDDNKWIFERLNSVITEVNNRYYQFDLQGYDFFQYSEYNAETSDRYDFHMDISLGSVSAEAKDRFRKLSLTLLLNEPYVDFEGGNLELSTSGDKDIERMSMQKGKIILFPSFIVHRVTPVTEGTRKSLVAWVQGPKFK